jgi:hypothetical protein
MVDLREQIEDDESIVKGRYFFKMGKCDLVKSKRKEDQI